MYLRLRKRRKPTDAPNSDARKENDADRAPSSGAEPAQPSPSDWVEPDSAGAEPADGPDISSPKHPNRGNAHESSRGSHR
jgi:hypothetical protein